MMSDKLRMFMAPIIIMSFPCAVSEVVRNGNLEQGMSYWQQVNYEGVCEGALFVSSTAHSGAKALGIKVVPTGSVGVWQILDHKPSSSYRLSFWVRFENGGQEIWLFDEWNPAVRWIDLPMALWVSFLPTDGGYQVRMRGDGQDTFEHSAFWSGTQTTYHQVSVYSWAHNLTRRLDIDGFPVIACNLTRSIVPVSVFLGDYDANRTHPWWEPQGGTVIWDDISLRSTTPEIEELIETVAQLEISYQDLLSRVSSYNASPVAIAQSVNGLHSGLVTVKKTIQDLEDSIEELGSVEELGPVEAELRSQILLIQDTVGVLEDKVRALEVNLLLSFAADNMQRIAQLNSSISDLATSVELRTSSLTESLDELAAELEHHQLNSTTQFLSIRAEMANTVNAITVVEEHLELLELSLAQTLEAMNRSVNWRIEDLAISINKTVETAASSLGGTLRQNQEETDESIGYLNRSLQQMMESNRADIQELDAEARQAEKRLRNLICASIALAVVSTTLSIVVVVQRRHT